MVGPARGVFDNAMSSETKWANLIPVDEGATI
jgi:hypothetical protein